MVVENNQLVWTPKAYGNYKVTLIASDGELSNEGSFTIEVLLS